MGGRRNYILYRDPRYGFILKFPSYWGPYCVINRQNHNPETEYTVHFNFLYKGNVYGPIFSVTVFRMTREKWLSEGYEDSPLHFIAEQKGRVFAYDTPGELPYAFVNPKTGDYNYKKYGKAIQLLTTMVNRDVPLIVNTIRFAKKARTFKSIPCRSKQIRAGRCRT